ncbi:hypothetical protein FA13DRAFT_1774454 [Coprinellus micaceus]|uniref:Uncharacterized protein n=1 Tax=Coprinellus micaceus TaxID=71717 RepID=A0A4Y7TA09_COPMI|nr:hypothetical protein FA13DRAFT_1774454 [Coprinellus micaceus]
MSRFPTVPRSNPGSSCDRNLSGAAMDKPLSPKPCGSDAWAAEMAHEELSKKSFMIDVVVGYPERSSSPKHPVSLAEVWVRKPGDSGQGECFALTEIASGRWEVWGAIELPSGVEEVECVIKSKEGAVVGSSRLTGPSTGRGRDVNFTETEGGVEPIYTLQVADIQQSDVVTEGALHLEVSRRVIYLLLNGGNMHDIADHLGRSSLSIAKQRLKDGIPEQSIVDSSEYLDLRTAVQLTAKTGDLVESMLSALTRLELQRFKSTGDQKRLFTQRIFRNPEIPEATAWIHQGGRSSAPPGRVHWTFPTFPHGKLPPTPHRTPPFGGAPRCFGEGPGAPDVRPSVTYVGPPFLAAAHRSARPKGLELNRRMVARRSDPAKHSTKLPTLLDSLVDAFNSRWKRLRDLADLDAVIFFVQKAVEVTPPGGERLLGRLACLGNMFGARFLETNDVIDISGAISTWERALEHRTYKVSKSPSDLDKALSFTSLAADNTPEVDANLWGLLFIGHEFDDRSHLTNSVNDIDKSIIAFRRAAQLIPPESKHLMDVVTAFAEALKGRFYRTRDASDIAEAIATVQRVTEACPEGHPSLPSLFKLLGSTFEARFDHDGDPSDISASVSFHRKAIALTPANDPRFPSFACALGSSLHTRFHSSNLKDVLDGDEAIAWYRRASDLCDNNELNQTRRSAGGDTSLVEEAMSIIGKATRRGQDVVLIPEHAGVYIRMAWAPKRPGTTDAPQGQDGDVTAEPMLLSAMFFSRFSRNKDDSDISEAISLAQRALGTTQEEQGGRQTRLHDTLGALLDVKSRSAGDAKDGCAAVEHFKAAATSSVSSPEERFDSARNWASLSSVHYPSSPDTLMAFDTTLDLVVLVDSLGQATRGYFTHLQEATDLPPEAAAAACTALRIDKAVEWLEKGRCLVWSRLSHLRAPFERLREFDEDLAESLGDVAKQLQLSGPRQSSSLGKIRWFENLRDLRHACGTSPRPQVAPDAGTCGSCGVPAEARTWLLRRLGASKSTYTDEEARILHFVGR